MKKGQLEKRRLNEGLSRPIDQKSKGYELLAKMGYKPGMSLGRRRDEGNEQGIKEPIPMPQVKDTRAGLGHEQHQKEKLKKEAATGRGFRVADDYKVIDMTGPQVRIYDDIEAFSTGTSRPTLEDYTPPLITNIDYLLGAAREDIRKADRQFNRLENQVILLREERKRMEEQAALRRREVERAFKKFFMEYYRTLSHQLDSEVPIETIKESYQHVRELLPPNLLTLGSIRNELTRILHAINRAQRNLSQDSSATRG